MSMWPKARILLAWLSDTLLGGSFLDEHGDEEEVKHMAYTLQLELAPIYFFGSWASGLNAGKSQSV